MMPAFKAVTGRCALNKGSRPFSCSRSFLFWQTGRPGHQRLGCEGSSLDRTNPKRDESQQGSKTHKMTTAITQFGDMLWDLGHTRI